MCCVLSLVNRIDTSISVQNKCSQDIPTFTVSSAAAMSDSLALYSPMIQSEQEDTCAAK